MTHATVSPIVPPLAYLGPGRWLVPSESQAGQVHIVVCAERDTPGLIDLRWCCDCPATVSCHHIARCKTWWAEAEGVGA